MRRLVVHLHAAFLECLHYTLSYALPPPQYLPRRSGPERGSWHHPEDGYHDCRTPHCQVPAGHGRDSHRYRPAAHELVQLLRRRVRGQQEGPHPHPQPRTRILDFPNGPGVQVQTQQEEDVQCPRRFQQGPSCGLSTGIAYGGAGRPGSRWTAGRWARALPGVGRVRARRLQGRPGRALRCFGTREFLKQREIMAKADSSGAWDIDTGDDGQERNERTPPERMDATLEEAGQAIGQCAA